jgi:hypothetical protein
VKLLPFGTTAARSSCKACGRPTKTLVKYCGADCWRTPSGSYIKIELNSSTEQPHLHVTCGHCGYEEIEQVKPNDFDLGVGSAIAPSDHPLADMVRESLERR